MKETVIKELVEVDLKDPILIEGLPGLGLVGKIATRYLIKRLKAKKFAHLHSPHLPYFVLVNKKGNARLLRGTFYASKNQNGKNDFILFTGDSQAQTIEGQYEISDSILDFAEKQKVRLMVTIGGYRKEVEDNPEVVVAATDQELLERTLQAGAILSSRGSPIVGTAGLILGLARFRKMNALCLLGETRGYLPDPKAAKSVLNVLKNLFDIDVDLAGLDEQIVKADDMVNRLQKIEKKRASHAEEIRKEEDKKITYIS
ncbi:MAG: proteasome assembly chaperone family protein [Candidatus Korarchaeota archaeon]|nr:proteasome assembly chaperone family protein [Candidatus Korarchaeota archaeon]NIU85532.1 proteasome assembly chaperone family protein [Candidatus Thorarchaeota archaeon]NIW15643.1 proteasome assembly chaperone family protein [Candidatus Thorarchaeota archaeon]